MCGRYVLRKKPKRSELKDCEPDWAKYWNNITLEKPRFNIGPHPHAGAPIITNSGPQDMLFGMKPEWAKSALINAKSETLKQSKFWKPLAAMRPCLVPADGFYEPKGESPQQKKGRQKPLAGKQKRPWYGFEFEDQRQFFMAGMWKHMDDQNRFVILTREPNASVKSIHNRMPVIFTSNEVNNAQIWLNTELDFDKRLASVNQTFEHAGLKSFPVSEAAKNLGKEGEALFTAI